VQSRGEGNHDGLVNAKACNEDQDVDDYYSVTTYTSLRGDACELGAEDGVVECRGTGRFADVDGSADMSVNPVQTDADPFIPWDSSARWVDGTVTYAAE